MFIEISDNRLKQFDDDAFAWQNILFWYIILGMIGIRNVIWNSVSCELTKEYFVCKNVIKKHNSHFLYHWEVYTMLGILSIWIITSA